MSLPLVLASSSAARFMLLSRLLIPFSTYSPDIDETEKKHEAPLDLVARLTKEKSDVVALKFPNSLIISADQVVVVKGKAISKPESYENAIEQLLAQSNQVVEALSGVGLLNTVTQHYQYACVKTQVLFRPLTLEQIKNYLAKDEAVIQCAGSLRVEGLGISLLEKIDSDDPTALIGLPLITLCKMLRFEGVISL